MTNFANADHPRVDNGTFTDKLQTSPEIAIAPRTLDEQFSEIATIVWRSSYAPVLDQASVEKMLANAARRGHDIAADRAEDEGPDVDEAWAEHQVKFPRFGNVGKQRQEFVSAFNAGR